MALSRTFVKFAVCSGLAVAASMFGLADMASAHNALSTSEPIDGASFDTAPTTWTLTFTGEVPLESASAEVVLADGTRAALPAPVHGATTSQIVFTLPSGLSGEVTGRWRLVGTDGHVITGRVGFTVTAAPPAVVDDVETTSDSTTPGGTVTDPTGPDSAANSEDLSPTLDELIEESATIPSFVDPISEQVRWVFQILSYIGLIVVGGLVFADLVLARGILRRPRPSIALQGGALLLFVVPAIKSLIHIADLEGVRLTSAFRYMGSLVDTTAGSMLAMRTLIGFVLLMVTLSLDQRPMDSRFVKGIAGIVVLHILTVPFTGHSRSMRWPALGVPADIVHLVGITIWVGGLVALVAFIMPAAHTANAVTAYLRFSSVASWAVIAIVITGVIQTIRLHSDPLAILDSSHGVFLVIKVLLVASMLVVGWWSRRLLSGQSHSDDDEQRSRLIRVTGLEAGLGVVVIGVSAALVRATFTV